MRVQVYVGWETGFIEGGKSFVFLTDNELGYRHRGGKAFEEYAEFALHHNRDRGDENLDGIVQRCREIIEAEGGVMECFALSQDPELGL